MIKRFFNWLFSRKEELPPPESKRDQLWVELTKSKDDLDVTFPLVGMAHRTRLIHFIDISGPRYGPWYYGRLLGIKRRSDASVDYWHFQYDDGAIRNITPWDHQFELVTSIHEIA